MKIHIPALNENLTYENNAIESFYDTKDITEEEFVKAKEALKTLYAINNSIVLGKRKSTYFEVEYVNRYDL